MELSRPVNREQDIKRMFKENLLETDLHCPQFFEDIKNKHSPRMRATRMAICSMVLSGEDKDPHQDNTSSILILLTIQEQGLCIYDLNSKREPEVVSEILYI